jgi:hypothetical protein
MSVARVNIVALLTAAFTPNPKPLPPFQKYYLGAWNQPGIGGLSTDLQPGSIGGSPSVTYDAHLKRYVVIADDTTNISYGESPDGVNWTSRLLDAKLLRVLHAPHQLEQRDGASLRGDLPVTAWA